MEWIFDHFQIVVILAVIVGSLVKQVLDSKAAERKAKEQQDEGDIFDPGEDWEPEFPQPKPSVPPPLARPSTPPPVAFETEGALKRQQDMQERLRQIKEANAANQGTKASNKTSKRAKAIASVETTLRSALHNRSDIRRAIVMREILGPPVGLR